jgi:hypothetical protein
MYLPKRISMSLSETIYHFLLLAYPRSYRSVYAEPMQQLFRDRLREVHSISELAALWARTLADWAVSVPKQYWEVSTPHPHLDFASLDSGRRCLFFARHEASSFSRDEIKLEHLLLGILRQEPSVVRDANDVVRAIEANEPARRRPPPMEDLRCSWETARVWEAASRTARAAGRQLAPRDLVEGILREKDTLAARLLRENGTIQP